MNSAAWKDLAGNAMHLQLLEAIMAYFLSAVVRVPAEFRLSNFRRGITVEMIDSQTQDVESPSDDEDVVKSEQSKSVGEGTAVPADVASASEASAAPPAVVRSEGDQEPEIRTKRFRLA